MRTLNFNFIIFIEIFSTCTSENLFLTTRNEVMKSNNASDLRKILIYKKDLSLTCIEDLEAFNF
jgi:hypothetical protein